MMLLRCACFWDGELESCVLNQAWSSALLAVILSDGSLDRTNSDPSASKEKSLTPQMWRVEVD